MYHGTRCDRQTCGGQCTERRRSVWALLGAVALYLRAMRSAKWTVDTVLTETRTRTLCLLRCLSTPRHINLSVGSLEAEVWARQGKSPQHHSWWSDFGVTSSVPLRSPPPPPLPRPRLHSFFGRRSTTQKKHDVQRRNIRCTTQKHSLYNTEQFEAETRTVRSRNTPSDFSEASRSLVPRCEAADAEMKVPMTRSTQSMNV